MELNTQLRSLSGIGDYLSYKLKKLGLVTVEDLIYHFPFRYEDFSNLSSVTEAQIGEKVTLVGEIWSIKNVYTRSRKVLTQAILNDGTAPIELTWFNQPWLTKSIVPGDQLQISGKIQKYHSKLSIVAPQWEKLTNSSLREARQLPAISNQPLHTGRLVPVYPETEGLTSKWLRTKIAQLLPLALPEIVDPLPKLTRDNMLKLPEAIQKIHQPDNSQDIDRARERLGFDELFYIQLATQKTRAEWKQKPAIQKLTIDQKRLANFFTKLPFQLTNAQKRVIQEILADLNQPHPMNRLVQGEVGSGKTVVAAAIAFVVHSNSLKTLYMAPTEILAFQHLATFSQLLEPFGIKVGIYTGSKKSIEGADVIVGTHALLFGKLMPPDVGLIIVDEQQRFGVEQRALLRSKAKLPHFLTMTATPIPRTVVLTIYGDLDLSVIDELPKNRQQIKTFVVPGKKRQDAYRFIAKKVALGDQAYIITPLIEESETLASAKAATVEFERLQSGIFPDLKLGLLHGRIKSKDKDRIMRDFKEGSLDILVATSVVEVGVDVPNATIMVIENAERFGLAQLHQLRGRIGRGVKESFCLLFSGTTEPQAISRLKNLERITDGLKLAELDLKIRGGGELFGTRQSGRFDFKIASFSDLELIEKTRTAAQKILQDNPPLDKYPALKAKLATVTANASPD